MEAFLLLAYRKLFNSLDSRFERGRKLLPFSLFGPRRIDLQSGTRKLVDRQAHLGRIFLHYIDHPRKDEGVLDLSRIRRDHLVLFDAWNFGFHDRVGLNDKTPTERIIP